MRIETFLLVILVVFVSFSCSDDDETVSKISQDILDVNEWINENMDLYYLWRDQMPEIDYAQENDPESYFDKLIYDKKDKWSWITDDYASLEAEYAGDPVVMGFGPSFYRMSDEKSVFIVVDYVYPDSPAEKAGLQRGDIILSINNTELDTTNYYDLYSQSSYSVQLGRNDNNLLSYTGESIDLVAAVTETNPIIYHDVIDVNGTKIGYLVYVEFITGDNDQFLSDLDDVFSEFNAAGISDLIVDLRYNPGGDIDAAAQLASEIAPSSVISAGETLISMKYNDDFQEYLDYYSDQYEDYLYYKFKSDVTNANMNRVYFLTSSGTASASELVISGLDPYMDVVKIGEATYGKCYGAWVIPDEQKEWAMIPIVMKYANANGYTDFTDGIPCDYEVDFDEMSSTPLGDLSDLALSKALSLASGSEVESGVVIKSAEMKLKRLTPRKLEMKRNLLIPIPPRED